MKRFAIALLFAVAGYILAAVVGYFLVLYLSSNQHDRELEAAMTSIFFFGPSAAVVAFIIGVVRRGPVTSFPKE